MRNELCPTVQAVAEFIPPRKNGIFERSMEVARLLLENDPISKVTNTINNAIQNYGMMREIECRVKALEYVTHLEEVRINAQVEMARMQGSNAAITMYIDRQFQRHLDYVQDCYFNQANLLECTRREMIRDINSKVQTHFRNIDERYLETVRENELKCAMYRDFLHDLDKNGIKESDIWLFCAEKLVNNMDRYNNEAVVSISNLIQKMITRRDDVSFERYLEIQRSLKRL